jgi:hypothetical protein
VAALNVELTARLDVSTLVQGLLADIAGPAGNLQGIAAPLSDSQSSGVAEASASFDSAGLEGSISGFAGTVAARLDGLPGAGEAIAQITGTLATIEQLATGDPGGQLLDLLNQLRAELEGEGGVIGVLLKLSDLLGNSPLAVNIRGVLGLLTGGAGIFPQGMGDLLPGIANVVRVIGGLMVYESVLSETERLTATVGALFDANRARQELDNVATSLQSGSVTLAERLAATNEFDAVALDAVTLAVEQTASRLSALNDYVSERMGFGEATLEFLDINAIQLELATAGVLLREPDLGALKRFLEMLVSRVEPYITIDPSQVPVRTVDQVLGEVEAQRDQIVSQLESLDIGVITGPLADGIAFATTPLRAFSDLLAEITLQIRSVLDQVRGLVENLPFDDIANGIRAAVAPVADAIRFIQEVVDEIKAALETAVTAAKTAMEEIEQKIDAFKQAIEAVFADAKGFIDDLHLDQIAATIGGKVQEFSDLLAQADMKPYFDTAVDAIGGAADVIGAVPFELIPESMKAEVDEVCEPIRAVDAAQVAVEIEGLVGISAEGKFEVRVDLEASLAGLQAKFEEVLKVLEDHNPRQYLAQIDAELETIAGKIRELAPALALEPVQEAIDDLKAALAEFDPDEALQPVADAFAQILAKMNEYSPAALIQPLEDRVRAVREQVIGAMRLDQWRPAVDDLAARATEVLTVLDPDALEEQILDLLGQLREEIARMPDVSMAGWLGTAVSGLLRTANLRVTPSSFDAVLQWMETGSGAADLAARAGRIADALARAKTQVEGFDPAASAAALLPRIRDLRSAAIAFSLRLGPGSPHRLRFEASIGQLAAESLLGELGANRTRYLGLLNGAVSLAEAARRTGMSEVDVAVDALKDAVSPIGTVRRHMRELLAALGITGTENGLREVLQRVLDDATITRLGNLVVPLVRALHGRIVALIDGVVAPIRSAIEDVETLVAQIDIAPLRISLQSIFDEAVSEVSALNPLTLLAEPLGALRDLRQELLAFDPLAAIVQILEDLRDTAARILEKLNVQQLLATPLAIYDQILAAFATIDLNVLLIPILDRLDAIALNVDEGLDRTVAAFVKLQEALPPPGGGSSVSVDVAVSVGI